MPYTSHPTPDLAEVLVAHRGEPLAYPENSLAGYRAALRAGARYLETDVQLSADGVPVLSHDPTLLRAAGQDIAIAASAYAQLCKLPTGFAAQFGERYATHRLTPLAALVELLLDWPGVTVFVEIKPESHAACGAAAVDRVVAQLRPIAAQSVIISFEPAVLERVRAAHQLPIGWILPEWTAAAQTYAERLAPQYLFVSRRHVPAPPAALWPGPWRWVVYTVNDTLSAAAWLARGFDLVETDCLAGLLASPAPAPPGPVPGTA